MEKNPERLWLTVIVLGWLFDLLFWYQSFGLNFAVFTLLCWLDGVLLLWMNGQRTARGSLWLAPLIPFFAAATAVHAEPMTLSLAIFFPAFLMGVPANTFAPITELRPLLGPRSALRRCATGSRSRRPASSRRSGSG
jgi:hypothetical protein